MCNIMYVRSVVVVVKVYIHDIYMYEMYYDRVDYCMLNASGRLAQNQSRGLTVHFLYHLELCIILTYIRMDIKHS